MLVIISDFMTFALLTVTLPDANIILIFLPLIIFTLPDATFAAGTLAATTWYVKISCSLFLFSGFSSESKVPFGNLANASSVGENTVKGHNRSLMS